MSLTTPSAAALFSLSALSTVLVSGAAPQDDASKALTTHLEGEIGRQMKAHDLEGMVVVISVGDQILLQKGQGRLPGGRIAEPDQPVRAQVLVEPLTAIAALQLVGEGKLKLDQTTHSVLEGLKWDEGEVQVQQLLGQTSGLIGWDAALPPHERGDASVASLLELVKGQGLESTPGTCFSYSESNALVLGAMVESITGKSLDEVITQKILEPAKLESTGFDLDDVPPTVEGSIGTREIGGELIEVPEGVHPFREDDFCASALDLLRLRLALSDGTLLEEAELSAFTGPRRLDDGTPTGYGLGVNQTQVGDHSGVSMGGTAEGMSMHLAYYPDPELTVIVMAAAEEAPVGAIERNLARLVLDLPLPGVQDLELSPSEAAPCVGNYQLGCTTLTVELNDEGQLTLTSADRPTDRLLYQGQHRFISSRDAEFTLEFVVEDGGKHAARMILEEHGRVSEAVRFPG